MHNRLTLGYMTDKALKSVSHEDANALTHINLAFGVIRDGLLDMSRLPNIREIDRIRDYNATLKIVLSIGGWGAGGFSPMVGREDRRAAFIESCAKAVQTYGLDGIDIDWEYPCLDWAGIERSQDKERIFSLLLEGCAARWCAQNRLHRGGRRALILWKKHADGTRGESLLLCATDDP